MKQRILWMLDEKVNEVYQYFQEELNIRSGDIYPLDAFGQDEILDKLAELINKVLEYEMEE